MADDPEPQPSSSSSSADQKPPRASFTDTFLTPRSRKQFGVFAAGASFCVLSALITRRRITTKRASMAPSFYQPSNARPKTVNGAMEALEALNLATLNVMSGAIMVTGGAMWAADIGSIDELRTTIRGGLGVDGSGRTEQEAEEEMEEWLASVLARKDRKEEERRKRGQSGESVNERGRPR